MATSTFVRFSFSDLAVCIPIAEAHYSSFRLQVPGEEHTRKPLLGGSEIDLDSDDLPERHVIGEMIPE